MPKEDDTTSPARINEPTRAPRSGQLPFCEVVVVDIQRISKLGGTVDALADEHVLLQAIEWHFELLVCAHISSFKWAYISFQTQGQTSQYVEN